MNEYSQGICEDGAAILKNGQMMTIEEILAELQERDRLKASSEKLREINNALKDENARLFADIERLDSENVHIKGRRTSYLESLRDVTRERDQLKAKLDTYDSMEHINAVGLAEHDAQVIEQFKNELVKSVNVLHRIHIEGVCAVVQHQLRQKAQEPES